MYTRSESGTDSFDDLLPRQRGFMNHAANYTRDLACSAHPTPEETVQMIKHGVREEMNTLYEFSPENPLVWEGLILMICLAIFGVTKKKYGPKAPSKIDHRLEVVCLFLTKKEDQ
jgi:hypothetical protein